MPADVEDLIAHGIQESDSSRLVRLESVTISLLSEVRSQTSLIQHLSSTINGFYKEFLPRKEAETLLGLQTARINGLEAKLAEKDADMKKIEKESMRRPSWITSTLFTCMSSLLVGLIVFALSKN